MLRTTVASSNTVNVLIALKIMIMLMKSAWQHSNLSLTLLLCSAK